MGFGGISIWNLLIILAIIVLLFGTKKLRGIGTDLGSAIKGFRSSLKDEEANPVEKQQEQLTEKAPQQTESQLQKNSSQETDKR